MRCFASARLVARAQLDLPGGDDERWIEKLIGLGLRRWALPGRGGRGEAAVTHKGKRLSPFYVGRRDQGGSVRWRSSNANTPSATSTNTGSSACEPVDTRAQRGTT